jgi:hypothetical protein
MSRSMWSYYLISSPVIVEESMKHVLHRAADILMPVFSQCATPTSRKCASHAQHSSYKCKETLHFGCRVLSAGRALPVSALKWGTSPCTQNTFGCPNDSNDRLEGFHEDTMKQDGISVEITTFLTVLFLIKACKDLYPLVL